jgi:uncharacterized protein YggE
MPAFARAPRVVHSTLFLLVSSVAGAASLGPARSALADTLDVRTAPTISVVGRGEVTAPPDVVRADVGVETRERSIGEAVRQNDIAMTKVVAALEQHGVAPQDRRTTAYTVDLERTPPGTAGRSEEESFRAFNQIHVTIRDLPRASEILEAAVDAGANNLSGVRFGVADERALSSIARARAVQAAQRDAETMAHAAGVELGPVLSIGETKQSSPIPRALSVVGGSSEGPPLEAGQLTVSADVTMEFGLAASAGNGVEHVTPPVSP